MNVFCTYIFGPCVYWVIYYFFKVKNKSIACIFQNIGWNRSIKVTFIAIHADNYLFEPFGWDWMETELSIISIFLLCF